MPEGDSIWQVAELLRPALAGAALTRFEAPRLNGPRPRLGERIASVEAAGKHLLVTFERGVIVATHLRMSGSWQLVRGGERWRRPRHLARLVIGVDGWEAVCFAAPVVRSALSREELVGHLGPDLALADADLDAAVRRLAALAATDATVADALLEQRVAAGLGNVYKSEVLWAERAHPATPIGELDPAQLRTLLERGAQLLRANLRPGPRVTNAAVAGGHSVYGRRGRPCPRCGTAIVAANLGSPPRSTYWCPTCQVWPVR